MGLTDHWLVQTLVGQALWLVLGILGAAVLTAVRVYWPQVSDVVLFGVAGFVLIAILVLALRVVSKLDTFLETQPPVIQNESIRCCESERSCT